MSVYIVRLTPQGEELKARADAGETYFLKKVLIGSGVWTEGQLASRDLTSLVRKEMELAITEASRSGSQYNITAYLSNSGVTASFQATEVGIVAEHETLGEVLYAVGYCSPATATTIVDPDTAPLTYPVPISVAVGTTDNVTVLLADGSWVTKAQLTRHNDDDAAHPGLRVQVPTLVITGPDHVDEGETTILAVHGYIQGTWPTEAEVKITDPTGADVTSQFGVAWDSATGLLTLTAPMVAASNTYQVAAQLWEHGLIRGNAWSDPVTLLVADVPVHQPSITAPAAGASGQGANPTLTSSAYQADGGQTHVSSRWQVALTQDMASPVYDSGEDSTHLVSCPIPAGSSLLEGQHYYCRVQHKGSGGDWSTWSAVSDFFTSASFVYVTQPSITSPASGATGIEEAPTLTSSAFGTNGEGSHASTDWQVDLTTGDFSDPVYESLADAANLTSLTIPAGNLLEGQTYKARVRYRDDSATPVVSDWSGLVTFSTAASWSPASKWAGWDEASEATLASPEIYVALMGNPTAGGNEIGQGTSLGESDRTLTQEGTIPGATGSPPVRAMGASRRFLAPSALLSAMLMRDTYTVILKISDIQSLGLLADMRNSAFRGIYCDSNRIIYLDNNGNYAYAASLPTAGTAYLVWTCRNGVGRFGWCATKPVRWSDIPAGQRSPTYEGGLSGATPYYRSLFNHYMGSYGGTYDAAYVVLSSGCLIDLDN